MPISRKTPKAREDLLEIWLYTYQRWGEQQADRYLYELGTAFKLLSESPLICHLREEISPPVRIYHFNHHMIVYTETEGGIDIIRVLHNRIDYEDKLG
tara:strand:+ start:597 stop:890 length:294 start_codon:yes stop_codon:yes gene_type:complete